MRASATWLVAWGLACAAAAAQPPAPDRPTTAPAARPVPVEQLVPELKGLTAARPRDEQSLRADFGRAIQWLLGRMIDRNLSSRYRVEAREDLEAICLRAGRPGAEAERLAFCQAVAGVLSGQVADASRGVLVRMLEYVGRAESVPVLAPMLADQDGEVRERARRALAANPAPEAGDELRKALVAAVGADWRVALINALGYRRDSGSVEWLGKLLKDNDTQVALAAAAALGKIATPQAVAAMNDVRLLLLEPARSAVADALFACADQLAADGDAPAAMTIYRKAFENPTEPRRSRIVALRRLVAAEGERAVPLLVRLLSGEDEAILSVALELARELPGEAATQAIASLLPKAKTVQRTVELLELLGARGDPAAREAVLEAMAGRDLARTDRETVRLAGIKALGGVGAEQDVMLLVKLAGQTLKGKEEEQKLARASLRQLRGLRVNHALIGAIGEADQSVRVEAIRALGARGAVEADTMLLNLVGDSDPLVRAAALDALGQVGDLTAVGPLVKWLISSKEAELYPAERAITMICDRAEDKDVAADMIGRAIKDANAQAKCALIRICGRLGGPSALNVLARAVEDPDERVRETAVRTLAQSSNMNASEALLKVARTAASEDNRVLALRGYIRLVQYVDEPPEKKIWRFIQIMDLATRAEERKLAIAGLGDVKTLAAMKFAMEHVDSKELRSTAEQTACRVARHICGEHPNEVIQAMQRLLGLTESTETAAEAKRIIALAQEAGKNAPAKP